MKIAAVLSAVLGLAPVSTLAQEEVAKPPPALQFAEVPRNLAEMLAIALRSNPGILQAEAKVRRAQADLNQARLKVMEEVVTAFHEREKQEAAIRTTEQALDGVQQRVKTGTMHVSETAGAEQALIEAKAKLVQGEAAARYLLGLGGLGGDAAGMGATASTAPSAERALRKRPPIPEKYRQALEKKVSRPIDFTTAATLAGSLQEELQTQVINVPGISNMHLMNGLRLEDQPLHVVLTAAADLCGVVLVFRDYGVLLTNREYAATMNAPTFPEDLPLRERGSSR